MTTAARAPAAPRSSTTWTTASGGTVTMPRSGFTGKGGDARMERQAVDRPALRIDELQALAKAVDEIAGDDAAHGFRAAARPDQGDGSRMEEGVDRVGHQGLVKDGMDSTRRRMDRERDDLTTGATGQGPVTPGSSLDVSAP